MMENAARARRWMLWAAPMMALAGLFFGVGGAAAGLALWMGLGLLPDGKGRIRLYPKQRRMKLRRLVLGYAFCVFCFSVFETTGQWLIGQRVTASSAALLTLGGVGFSLPLGAWATQWRMRRRLSALISFALQFFFLILLYFSNPIQPSWGLPGPR